MKPKSLDTEKSTAEHDAMSNFIVYKFKAKFQNMSWMRKSFKAQKLMTQLSSDNVDDLNTCKALGEVSAV